jgi:plastocyanin
MRLGLLVSAAIVLSAAACGGENVTENNGSTGNTGATGATGNTGSTGSGGSTSSTITVTDGSFSPSSTTVALNTTVTWNFTGTTALHNVTFDGGSISGSGNLDAGAQFQKQFTTAGTYTYQCTNHYGMNGTINVQ